MRIGWRIGGMPTVQLHATGRRTGQPRTTVLSAPIVERDRVVLVASLGGSDRNPAWYLNLVASPDAVIELHDGRREVRARTASPPERAELWPRITAAYPGYARYQRRTQREIPVVILTALEDRVGRAALTAAFECGARAHEIPIWAWHWASPEDPRIPWERARKLQLDKWAQARKRHAIQAFASQLYDDPDTGHPPVLSSTAVERLQQPFEVVFL